VLPLLSFPPLLWLLLVSLSMHYPVSTCDPLSKQWLAGLGVGAGLWGHCSCSLCRCRCQCWCHCLSLLVSLAVSSSPCRPPGTHHPSSLRAVAHSGGVWCLLWASCGGGSPSPPPPLIGLPCGSSSGNILAHSDTSHRHFTSLRTCTNLHEHHKTSTNCSKRLRSHFAALRTTSHDFAALRTPLATIYLSYRPSDTRSTPSTHSCIAI
jgi:hypothetical protein